MHPIKILITIFICLPVLVNAQSLRINPQKLKNSLSDYLILDVRNSNSYLAGHIQGAINFPVSLTYEHQKVNGKITSPNKMQKIFRLRGLSKNSKVVIYDSGSLVDAARLFWTLEVYAIKQVKVLDHGYDYWIDKDYPISLIDTKIKPSKYVASIDHNRLASKFTTQLATLNQNQYIIDARATAAYQGKTSTAQRFGHIPTSKSYPANHNFQIDNNIASLQPIEKLKEIYSTVPRNQKIVIYCAIGRISSANYLALRELGYNVSNYDASWKEWGNDLALPIEK